MSYDEKLKIFKKIYEDIDGFSLSISERKKLSIDDKSFVYGEIVPESFYEILIKSGVNQDSIFYDLGSGVGKAVIFSKLFFNVKKAVGIEYLESLYQASLLAYNRLKEFIDINGIEFIRDDIFNSNFSDGDLIFINSTCFSEEQIRKIEEMALNLKNNSRIIILTKKLTLPYFKLIFEDKNNFSWGSATVRLYEKSLEI